MLLITFEGIDGSGKSTQLQLLREKLSDLGYEVKSFREPGGTAVSEAIRALLLDTEKDMDPVTELLLFSAARSELVIREVRPALEKGHIVLLDRFYDSTVAYQGFGRQSLEIEEIHRLNRTASHGLIPDITFYFKISLEETSKRIGHLEKDRMEKSGSKFFKEVIKGFDYLAENDPRIHMLDARLSREVLARQVLDIVKQKLASKNKQG